jgi:penicillin-binding protein 2
MRFWKKNYNKVNSSDPFEIKTGILGSLHTPHRLGWAEETFVTDNEIKETIGKNFDFKRLPYFYIFVSLFMLLLFWRTAWLQIVKGNYYYSMAEGNRIRVERIEAKRGVIYDMKMRPLVRNVANFMIYIIPADLPRDKGERDKIISSICKVLTEVNEKELKSVLDKFKMKSPAAYQPMFITDNIDYEKAMLLNIESDNWSGVILSNKTRREYNLIAPSLSHVIGYTGKINPDELKKYGSDYLPIDYVGKIGVEYFWENHLKGVDGQKQIEVDALGKEKKIIGEKLGEDGRNLVLTIDTKMQKKLEEIIKANISKMNLTKASAVVMDPRNGEIRCLISLPAYNDNDFAKGISSAAYDKLMKAPDKPLFNRTVSGEFPSGSTIKPIIAVAALQEGVITENTTVVSSGGIHIGQWFFPDWKAGGHGTVNVKSALANSVNTFFYTIGGGYEDFQGLGVDRIVKYLKLFNLGSQTGIDLAGEATGFVPTKEWKESTKKENWYIGDTYHLSIGQGDLLVTPLQVAMYTGFFANHGKIYRPHIVGKILSSDDKTIASIKEESVKEDFIDNGYIDIVREGMRDTILYGSAKSLQSVPVAVAGKTGTAQWSTKYAPHAWFTGFAPYDNPDLVITILIEEGKEGSTVAVPIAKEFLQWYYNGMKDMVTTSTPAVASSTPQVKKAN